MANWAAIGWAIGAAAAGQDRPAALPPGAVQTIQNAIAALDEERPSRSSHAATLRGKPGRFFGPDSYPVEARQAGEQGRVVARLAVGPDGRVSRCDVASSSGSASLDRRTCEIATASVTFTPARDARGRPIASAYTLPIRWMLPDTSIPRLSTSEAVRLTIGADGRLRDCRFAINDAPFPGEAPACADFRRAPPGDLRTRLGIASRGAVAVTMQRVVQFDGQPAISEAHAVPGEVLLKLKRVTFDVAPDGTRGDVHVTTVEGAGDLPDPSVGLDRFVAAPERTDHVGVLSAISWRAVR